MLSRTVMTTSFSASPLLSLTNPLTVNSLNIIRDALKNFSPSTHYSHGQGPNRENAAVLVPFCNVNDTPGILFEVRGKLRTHSGEVAFPGGRVDDTDNSYLAGALRETHEEVGIPSDRIEVLGQFGPPELNLAQTMRVWPFVGFIHRDPQGSRTLTEPEQPLPSISLSSLHLSHIEVASIFHLPLSALVSPVRLHAYKFREVGQPYFAVDVSDLGKRVNWSSDPQQHDEVGGGREGRLEIWGLTGWYLNILLKALRVYAQPEVSKEP